MRSFLLLFGGVPLMECNGISGEMVPVLLLHQLTALINYPFILLVTRVSCYNFLLILFYFM